MQVINANTLKPKGMVYHNLKAKYNNKVKLIANQSNPYFLLYICIISLHHIIE